MAKTLTHKKAAIPARKRTHAGPRASREAKFVYFFGNGKADGNRT